jgi:hypothetical protein
MILARCSPWLSTAALSDELFSAKQTAFPQFESVFLHAGAEFAAQLKTSMVSLKPNYDDPFEFLISHIDRG